MAGPDSTATRHALSTLLHELIDGSAKEACWILNPEDPGLIRSLELTGMLASVAHLAYHLGAIRQLGSHHPRPLSA